MDSSSKWYQKNWGQNLILVGIGIMGVYTLIYIDVVSRAREAYHEGEKYMTWHNNPEEKKKYFDSFYESEKQKLEKNLAKKKITQADFKRDLDILEFDREFNLGESSLKYAYHWYKDTVELFSPPESKWVRRAREKTPHALALWKQELDAKGVPYEDYMFE